MSTDGYVGTRSEERAEVIRSVRSTFFPARNSDLRIPVPDGFVELLLNEENGHLRRMRDFAGPAVMKVQGDTFMSYDGYSVAYIDIWGPGVTKHIADWIVHRVMRDYYETMGYHPPRPFPRDLPGPNLPFPQDRIGPSQPLFRHPSNLSTKA